jgi:hypothetical protein
VRQDEGGSALWKADGFAVEASGKRVGVVEGAIRIPGLKRPAALAVRLSDDAKRVVLVPVTEILEVDVDAHTIRLRKPPAS